MIQSIFDRDLKWQSELKEIAEFIRYDAPQHGDHGQVYGFGKGAGKRYSTPSRTGLC